MWDKTKCKLLKSPDIWWFSPDPSFVNAPRGRLKRTWNRTARVPSTPWTRRFTQMRRRPLGKWWIMCCGRWQQTGSQPHSNSSRVTCGGRRILQGESKASKYTDRFPQSRMCLLYSLMLCSNWAPDRRVCTWTGMFHNIRHHHHHRVTAFKTGKLEHKISNGLNWKVCLCPELQSDGQKNHILFIFPKKFSMTSMEKDVKRVQKDSVFISERLRWCREKQTDIQPFVWCCIQCRVILLLCRWRTGSD